MSKIIVVFCTYSLCISDCIPVLVIECLKLPFLNRKRHKNAIKNAGIKMQVLEAVLDLPSYIMNLKPFMNLER